ncbi:DUF481 domain-containing protein [Paenirhodobacter populi]|uniref:DUF481 domain-containing protein n=1 Tax=Paenirhodobacter populi TaxID=2306993 RepID=A0A443KED7_9RHOB|nr:DUF481 domain-containing protein [Sinirhodobacter populi]RWR09938.1 DUF481 domain-containing protein [Sinirhodobacter populi]RWR11336.1 DUF481 domain-containing protein [Sinirhodobacter populi]RWR20144.1 DUF481 domain-containing protein [Sinirhodobacter populi]RWR31187.1 DUF481 domain-containing protein [Sinirhodobacter populi]
MKLVTTSALLAATALAGTQAFAQSAVTGIDSLDDRITDVRNEANKNLSDMNDSQRFGPNAFRPGWSGAMALTYAGTSGNTDTDDLALAGKLTYGAGPWQHTFGVGIEYGKDDDKRSKQDVFGFYEGNYYFDDRLYAFGLARYEQDDFASYRKDSFVGVGPGYRVLNEQNMTWRVQAGIGARYYQVNDSLRDDDTEFAGIVSSRFYYQFNENVFLTNDTDILKSDAGTLNTNDLALNVKMTDVMTTRISYKTDFNSAPVEGRKKTDNTFGVSLVFGF